MSSKRINEKEAIKLLKKYSPDKESFSKVLSHSKAVRKTALEFAKKIPGSDIEFIKTASLLHDIGRLLFPPGKRGAIKHGIVGKKIIQSEGLDECYGLVCERHLGCGITVTDIRKQSLPLPSRNFVPKTVEEKIISYADNLIFGSRRGTIEEVIERFTRELGPEYGERIRKQHEEIQKLMKQ